MSNEWFVRTESFAAPFFSDADTRYVAADSAAAALEVAAAEYKHPCGLYSAAAWPSADAMRKGEKPAAKWLCNHEIERARLTDGLGCYTYMGHAPGKFEIDGVLHVVPSPKAGRVVEGAPMTDHKAKLLAMAGEMRRHADDYPDAGKLRRLAMQWAHGLETIAALTAAPAASEGEDGAVLWISPEDFRNPHFVGMNAVRAGHEQHGKHYTMPLYLRPAAQVADTPKHDEGWEELLRAAEEIERGHTWITAQGASAIIRKHAAALATQPAARRVTDDPRVAELIEATREYMRDDSVETITEVYGQLDRIRLALWAFAQPAEGVSGG